MLSSWKTAAASTLFALIASICCIFAEANPGSDFAGAGISSGSYSAGFVGFHAGQLAAGQAVSELQLSKPAALTEVGHDFSEGAAKNSPSYYETLGQLGDHLNEQNFPADYDTEQHKGDDDATTVYEEEEAAGAATTVHHAEVEQGYPHADYAPAHLHLNGIEYGGGDDGDFHSKPVPGIDHGKGAFSYSTTYEFKEPPPQHHFGEKK